MHDCPRPKACYHRTGRPTVVGRALIEKSWRSYVAWLAGAVSCNLTTLELAMLKISLYNYYDGGLA